MSSSRSKPGRTRNLPVATVVLGNLSGPIAGILIAPLLALNLGAVGRGDVAAATTPVLLAASAITLGAPEAVTYFVARRPASTAWALRNGLLMSATAALLSITCIMASASLLARGDAALESVILLCAGAAFPTLLVGVLRGLAAGQARWTIITIEKHLLSMLRIIGVIVLLFADSLTVLSASLVVAYAPALSGVIYLAFHGSPVDSRKSQPTFNDFARFSGRLWGGAVAGVLLARTDQLLLAPLSDTRQLGLYVVAVNIAEVPLMLSLAVREVVLSSEARDPSVGRLHLGSRLTLIVVVLVAVAIAVAMPLTITTIFGDEFQESVPSALILLLSVVLGVPGSVAGAALVGRGAPHLRSAALATAAVLSGGLVVLLVPGLGALGAALATLVGTLCASGIGLYCLRTRYSVPLLGLVAIRRSDISELTFRIRSGASR